MSQPERETLRQAATSAQSMLRKLLKQREKLDKKIEALQAVITAWEAISGKPMTAHQESDEHAAQGKPRGAVARGIREILRDGKSRTWEDIVDEFKKRYGWAPPKTTVFSTLRRLRMNEGLHNRGGQWFWPRGAKSGVDRAADVMHNTTTGSGSGGEQPELVTLPREGS